MTSARRPNPQPVSPLQLRAHTGEPLHEAPWPMALRVLLLLHEAAHPGDQALAHRSDEELAMLRAALAGLNGIEPTSAA
ncbi:MAG: hypothetical protein OHK0015_11880 [Chloroflexi bacterium OHK40]